MDLARSYSSESRGRNDLHSDYFFRCRFLYQTTFAAKYAGAAAFGPAHLAHLAGIQSGQKPWLWPPSAQQVEHSSFGSECFEQAPPFASIGRTRKAKPRWQGKEQKCLDSA